MTFAAFSPPSMYVATAAPAIRDDRLPLWYDAASAVGLNLPY